MRTRYNNNNTQLLHKYPKLKEIYFSHGVGKDKQFQKYKAADYARRRKERENALQTIDEPVIHRFIGGFEIPGEPTSKVKRARKRYINKHFPELEDNWSSNRAKQHGPKGQKKSIQRIRRGLNKSRNRTQKTYSYVGLPNNINSIYYRGKVPQMVKNSHTHYNSELYGPGVTPPKHTRFIEAPPRRKGRFTITSTQY